MSAFKEQAEALLNAPVPRPVASLASRLSRRFHGPIQLVRAPDEAWRIGRETVLEGGALIELPASARGYEVVGLSLLRLEQKSRSGISKRRTHHFKNPDNDTLAGVLSSLMETCIAFPQLKTLRLRGHLWLRGLLHKHLLEALKKKRYKGVPLKFAGWSLCYDLLLLRALLCAEQMIWDVEQVLQGYGAKGKAALDAASLAQRKLPEELDEVFEKQRLIDLVVIVSQGTRFALGKK